MPLAPKHVLGEGSNLRPFVGRHDILKRLKGALQEHSPARWKVVVLFGIGGIGKTRLRKKFGEMLGEAKRPWASLDFKLPQVRSPENALYLARKELQHRYNVTFPSFDVAYAAYWEKAHPQTALTRQQLPFLEDGDLLTEIVLAVRDIPGLGLLTKIPQALHRTSEVAQAWWVRRGQRELRNIEHLEAADILERLPAFWASDLRAAEPALPLVMFLDTYEVLWEGTRTEADNFAVDAWIREWILQLPEILWILLGRDALRWQAIDPEWSARLEQHRVNALDAAHSREFLTACGIRGDEIQNAIVASSGGVPFYLDLAVSAHKRLEAAVDPKAIQPLAFTSTSRELVDTFLRYLSSSEINTLAVLSVARYWDEELFAAIVTHFKTGYSPLDWRLLHRHSFVETTDLPNTWTMHALMRTALEQHIVGDSLRQASHRFLFEHYARKIEPGVTAKELTPDHSRFLEESFLHARSALTRPALLRWFARVEGPFRDAAQWRTLIPLQEQLIEVCVEEYGPQSAAVALNIRILADLYEEHAKYQQSEGLYKDALRIQESLPAPDPRQLAATLNNLAGLYLVTARPEDAEPLYVRSLRLKEGSLGRNHTDVGTTLNNMGELYRRLKRPEAAEPLFRRALEIKKRRLGGRHSQVGIIMNNLGELMADLGRFSEAHEYYDQALKIKERALGTRHPSVALTLVNIGTLSSTQGDKTEAARLYGMALSILGESLPNDHPRIDEIRERIGALTRSGDSRGMRSDT